MSAQKKFHSVIIIILLFCMSSFAQNSPRIGIRGGVGTDISLGLAYGAGVNMLLGQEGKYYEVGIVFFGGTFKETTDEGIHTYKETTDLIVFGLMGNVMINYTPNRDGVFYIVGAGLASINVSWEERSDTDVSLGTPLPGGGSMQSEDGTAGGTVLNLGMGKSFASGMDMRLEIPVIVTFAPPGGASSVVPTLILTIGFRM